MDRSLGSDDPLPAPNLCKPIFQALDYLFVGTPVCVPEIVVAGGILPDGTSVSGAGHDIQSALTRLAGETAEQLALRGEMPLATTDLNDALSDHPAAAKGGLGLRGVKWGGSQTWALPAGILPEDPTQTTGFSEGMAAHTDPNQARVHAALELIERDAVAHWWSGATLAVSLSNAHTYALARLGPRQERETLLLDVSCDTNMPVIVALSFDAQGGSFCFGAAAAARLEPAMNAALRELGAAEFGLVLERQKIPKPDTLQSPPNWTETVKRQDLERYMIGHTAEIETQSKRYAPIRESQLPKFLSEFDIHMIDLLPVCEVFHTVKAVSTKLQLGRETHHCKRFITAKSRAKRPYRGPLY
ncbi:MAG: YcaO-like family protein [Sulfitobacter sp.]